MNKSDKPVLLPEPLHRRIAVLCKMNDIKIKEFVPFVLEKILQNDEFVKQIIKELKIKL